MVIQDFLYLVVLDDYFNFFLLFDGVVILYSIVKVRLFISLVRKFVNW